MARERLEERILNLLSSQNMCVLATIGPDGPLATPVRYFHSDFTMVFTAVGTSPKMRNIGRDPRVSIGVFAPLVGQASSRGAQIFGRARVLTPDDPDFAAYWSVVRWQSDHVERSKSLDEPPTGARSVSSKPTASSTPSAGCVATGTPRGNSGPDAAAAQSLRVCQHLSS